MQSYKHRNSIILGTFLAVLMLTLYACNKQMAFSTSPIVPAARGNVKIKKDKNENYAIEINISGLAEVERLQGNKKSYVVWINTPNENAKNIGQITSSTKTFSKRLSASFQSVSTSKPTRVFITAEEDGTVEYPGNMVVLSTEEI
ncbi:MAG: hypothetical protein SFU20_00850 [Chitinophagaceae bacterium]|nr:hypothetical protein [Chitinophagaceae bacterium]